ncbi:spore maturation protein [Acutalibacter sp. 1XD8-33]|uniref:spore maturation protein n=1 Tax=Acutalibacter sp. 1XD8-33 TaxID=2320081 RepID=UPI0018F6899E|nr:nucleoside recognition domain-containing protein [Acutalibacter sp. 1XD8-33]
MEQIGAAALPVIIGVILLFGFFRGVDVFDAFLSGAKEGIHTSLGILPTLIGLIVAVNMVRASGLLDAVCAVTAPLAQQVGISPEIIPLALLRPISGSGASAYTLSLLEQFGPDSETGKIASVLASSTETTFYAITVYFGACQCKKLRYTLPAALLGDMAAVVLSVATVKWFGI